MSDTSTALSVRRPTDLGAYRPPPPKEELARLIEMANYLAKVPGFLPTTYFGQPYKIMAAMLYARELGISNFTALQHMQVIDGKAGADAQLMAALIIKAGHKVDPCLDQKIPGKSRTARITRGDTGTVFEVTWTIEMARGAGLVKERSGWEKYPDSMLWARALSQCAREGCPDALMGIAYTPEEIGGEVIDGDGYDGIDVTPPEAVQKVLADSPAPSPAEVNNGPAPGERSVPAPQGAQGGVAAEAGRAPETAASPSPASPAAPDRSARSVGPRAKRQNVVSADQTIPSPSAGQVEPQSASVAPDAGEKKAADAEGSPEAPVPSQSPASPDPHPVTLTDEEPAGAQEPEEDGRTVYLNSMREETRKGAGVLHLLRVKLKNQKAALAGQPMLPEPPVAPNTDSDESLRLFIDSNYPSRTLADLREGELENVLGVIQGLIDKIHQSGVKE